MSQSFWKYLKPILSPFTPVNSAVQAGDTLHGALEKVQGQIDAQPGQQVFKDEDPAILRFVSVEGETDLYDMTVEAPS